MNKPRSLLGAAISASLMLSSVGATATSDEPAFTANGRPHSIAIDWIEAMLEGIERNPPAPTATTWRMHVVMSSMYDAWAAYHEGAKGTMSGDDLKRPALEHTLANQEQAVSFAAHDALSHVFPEQVEIFDAVLDLHGLEPSASVDPSTPAGVGNIAADHVIRSFSAGGSNAYEFDDRVSPLYPTAYQPTAESDPNRWAPLHVPTGSLLDEHGVPTASSDDPSSYTTQEFLTPHWGSLRPFALEHGDELRPPPPPMRGSELPYIDATGHQSTNDQAFRSQVAEVLELSAGLSDRHKVIAEFWADGPHTWTPPGHWVQLAIGVSLRDQHDLEADVCMFMALAGALYDAGIVAWDAKRFYDYVRPATAIPSMYEGQRVEAWRGPDQGAGTIDGGDWRPYQSATFVTPPFAEYISGHSAFSAAAAEVLKEYSGSGRFFDGVTRLGRDFDGDGVEDLMGQHIAVPGTLAFEHGPADTVVLRWLTFDEASDQAGISRRYGGIHFQDADLRGREIGHEVGRRAFAQARAYWDPPAT